MLEALAGGPREGRASSRGSFNEHFPAVHGLDLRKRIRSLQRDNFDSTTLAASDVVDRLIGLYLLGDVLDDVKLRNYTLRLIIAVIKGPRFLLHPMQCHRVWRRTVPNSPLRKYVVDLVVTLSSPEVFRNRSAEYPMDLVLQAAIVLMERRQWTGYVDVEALEERLET